MPFQFLTIKTLFAIPRYNTMDTTNQDLSPYFPTIDQIQCPVGGSLGSGLDAEMSFGWDDPFLKVKTHRNALPEP
jgi:hypothetical protein